MIIDVNCDVGEGIGNESLILPFISSCNIACGGHAGNENIIREVIALANQNNVKVGAHPSFPDKENFGRKIIDISLDDLGVSLIEQILLVKKLAKESNVELHHIKAHGALYNLSAIDEVVANLIVEVVKEVSSESFLYVPYNSKIEKIAKNAGVLVKREVFADRNYNDDLTLVSRNHPEALLRDREAVLNHVRGMASKQKVTTLAGKELDIIADTFCIHGDTENAVDLVAYLHGMLPKFHIKIA